MSEVDHFIAWLRGMGVVIGTPSYEDDDGTDKIAIIVDLDKTPLDIEPNIDAVMKQGLEHIKIIVKQLGLSAWR